MNGKSPDEGGYSTTAAALEWKFSQVFDERTAGEEVQEVDIISAIQFDKSGDHIATGDKGGRIVLFERADVKDHGSRMELERSDYPINRPPEFRYKTEFQSHEPEFDYLKSLEIEEKINKIRWCQAASGALFLLSTNDKTIKYWKVQEKKLKKISEVNADPINRAGNGGIATPSASNRRLNLPSSGCSERSNYLSNDFSFPPGGFPSLRLPVVIASEETNLVASCRRRYAQAHDYHINSISNNSDGETFISADDLRVNLWNLEISNQSFNIVDVKPANMEDLTEPESGPVDGSVLYMQDNHRSNVEELMRSVKPVDCLDHSQSFEDLMEMVGDQCVQQLLHQAGFWYFMQIKYIRFDRSLITALSDRWRPETCTFHFSVGEMTITLQDVSILLGLPIEGAVLNYGGNVDAEEVCQRLLGEIPPPEAVVNRRELKVKWLNDLIIGREISVDSSIEEIEQFTRAVILLLIASRLFANHSKGRVSVKWLYLLEDFTIISDYSWGSAVLCALYKELDNVALRKTNGLAGCLTLLQVWSWTRISIGRPNVRANVAPGLPYGARWTGDRRWQDNPARHPTFYRNELDVMDEHAVDWTPYTAEIVQDLPPICLDGEHSWYARTLIICLQSVAMHYPDRVLRQYGLRQHIPDPAEQIFPHGWNRDLYNTYVARWDHRLDHVQAERVPRISIEQYYSWYWHITRRFVLKESSTGLPRYAPRGPVERDLVQGLYMISNEVDDVLADPADEDRVQGKCFNIKEIIKSLLGRHKLERPPPYVPRPPQAFGRTYQRRRFRGTGGPSQGSQPGQEIVEVGPSQPPPTQTQMTLRDRRNIRR